MVTMNGLINLSYSNFTLRHKLILNRVYQVHYEKKDMNYRIIFHSYKIKLINFTECNMSADSDNIL